MQAANGEGGMGMSVWPRPFLVMIMTDPPAVRMNVHMPMALVNMFVGVDVGEKRLPKPPEPNPNQGHSNHLLGPCGKALCRPRLPKEKKHGSHQQHTAGVAQSPPEPGLPGLHGTLEGKRRQGCQMVWSGQNMDGSRQDSC